MANLNLTDQFFSDVQDVIAVVGDADKVFHRAVKFMQLAQERYGSGRIITVTEFKARGFYLEFIGIIAEYVDEHSIMAIGADKEFGWLRKRRLAASKGGQATADAHEEGTLRDSDSLEPSKREPNESQNGAKPEPNRSPITITMSLSKETNTHSLRECSPAPRKSTQGPPKTFPINSFDEFKTSLEKFLAGWEELYPGADFIDREVKQAVIWLKAHPAKNRKSITGWVRFFGGWFARSWDKHTTKGPSNRVEQDGDSWDSRASKVAAALKKWPDWSKCEGDVRGYLGAELYSMARKAGTYDMRRLPGDRFFNLNVIKRLKDAEEALKADKFQS